MMKQTGQFLIYGATGFTGKLTARTATDRDLKPILAGRNEAKLKAVALPLGLQYRVFELCDAAALDATLGQVDAVLHMAGPFCFDRWSHSPSACFAPARILPRSRQVRTLRPPSFKGIIAPARSYDIAPPFDGQIIKIHFVLGEWVEKGALLFTMDTTKEALELERDHAILMRAEAELRIAELVLRNNRTLRSKNVVSERQYLESEARRDIAVAAVVQARVQVKGDEIKIKELKRYAPFSGIMSRPTVAEGAHLIKQARENTGMATITELDPILVKATVPFTVYIEHLKLLTLGEKTFDRTDALNRIEVFLTLPSGEKYPHFGKIAGGGYEFDPNTQVMEVMVEFPNPGLLLRSGLAVSLQGRVKPSQ